MNKAHHIPIRQRGATLIIGLVLLLVLSVLGVSTMSGATFGLVMVGNAQYSENAFQMAETGIELSLAGFTGAALNTAIPLTTVTDRFGDVIGTYQATTQFQESTLAPSGNSAGTFEACHFQTQAIGTAARNASSRNTQEFYVICPGGS